MSRPNNSTMSLLARVLARMFATLTSAYSGRPHGLLCTRRDGTDPLLGGHAGAPGAGLQPRWRRPGGTS
jgi:hypothetical protein